MSKQRLCATCGHRYSMSAKSCPHCNRETAKQAERSRDLCDELGCTHVATVFVADRKRCSEHFAQDRREPQVCAGEGYAMFKKKLEELRK